MIEESQMLKILVLGATSAIAHETMRHFAQDGARFYLVGRSVPKLGSVAHDLQTHGAKQTETYLADLNDLSQHEALLQRAITALEGVDAVYIAHGTLSDQTRAQTDVDYLASELMTNFTSTASLLTHTANYMEAQKRGVIAVISSVAGDRGRASNYVYGSAMAAKTAFVSGLRNRLAKAGVQVITIKPGLIDTPMTAHLKRGRLMAHPSLVGEHIYRAMKRGEGVVYTPSFWRYIMLIIRALPEAIFKRMSLSA